MSSQFRTHKVSDATVKHRDAVKIDKPVKGSDWFPEPYANIFLLAKKQSGKTTLIENILERTAGKRTQFIFVVSTIHKDPTWKRIVETWEEKGHDVYAYDDLYDGKENVIQDFIDTQKEEGELELEQEENAKKMSGSGVSTRPPPPIKFKITPTIPMVVQNMQDGGKSTPKPRKERSLYPEWCIVLDDLGKGMRDQAVEQLLKTNRHFKSKVILSSQDLHDLTPASIRNLDYVLAFGRVPAEKMEKLRENLLLDIEPSQFAALYEDATRDKFNFLYISRSGGTDRFRKNFNYQYDI